MFRGLVSIRALIVILLCSTFQFVATDAKAQAAKGEQEFSISGDIFIPVKDTQGTTGLVSGNLSHYFTRRFQAGIGGTFNFFADTQDVYDSKGNIAGTKSVLAVTSDPQLFFRYNFPHEKSPTVPYVGLEAGTSIQSDGNTTQFQDNFYMRPNIGFKYYFSKRAAFDWNTGYQAVVKDSSNGTMDFRMGISVLL